MLNLKLIIIIIKVKNTLCNIYKNIESMIILRVKFNKKIISFFILSF